MRLAYANRVGSLARIVSAVGKAGGDIGAVDIVASDAKGMTRDITVRPHDAEHRERIIAQVRRPSGVTLINVSDRLFLLHLGADMGFDVWVARNDRSKPCNRKLLGEFPRIKDALPLQFDEATNRTIELIDVLWLKAVQ